MVLFSWASASDSPGFRGADRDGHFQETGLLKSWPEGGPTELWSVEGLGQGYSSVSVVDGVIFTTGKKDDEGSVFAYDLNGKLKWKSSYGKEGQGRGFPGARSTPTIDDGLVYVMSGFGVVVAFNQSDGAKVWEIDTVKTFGGGKEMKEILPSFEFSESVLIDGNNLICTPGGKDASVVALNKKTGATVWTSKGLSDSASYCAPRIFDNGKHRQIMTLTSKALVGLDPQTGTLLWRQEYPVTYDISAVSPVFDGNLIYLTNGYKQGGSMFELAADGKSVTKGWKEDSLDVHHGGCVLVNGYIFGASSKGKWTCLELTTGKIMSEHTDLGKGSVITADGMLVGYDEKGNVGLMKADPNNFKVISSFKIEKGSGQHWGHPVISGGILYIRHGDALMAFDIKAAKS